MDYEESFLLLKMVITVLATMLFKKYSAVIL